MATDIFITPASGTVDFNNGVAGSVLGTIATMKVYDSLTTGNLSIQNATSGVRFLNRAVTGNIFEAYGTYGNMFTISDDLTDSIFSVNNSAGLPVLDIYSNNSVFAGQYGQNDFVITGNKIGIGTPSPSQKLHIVGIGFATASLRAPIFIDSDNITYYCDPSSTSNFVGLTVANTITGSVSGSSGSCTGNAASASYAPEISLTGLNNGSVNVNNPRSAVYRNENGSGAALAYAPVLHLGGGDTMWQIQGTYGSSGNGTLYFRQGYNGSWGTWLTMLSSANYNSYSPTLTGTGASGSWGISVTGSSASCTGNSATVSYSPSRTDSTTYPILWGSGTSTTQAYSCASVKIQSSTGTIYCTNITDNDDTNYYLDPNGASVLYTVRAWNFFGLKTTVTAAASTTINTTYNLTELSMIASITTLTLSNIQATGVHMWTIVTVGNGTAYSIAWPAAVKWPSGTGPNVTGTNTKRDIYQFVTYDGGTNIYAIIVGQNL